MKRTRKRIKRGGHPVPSKTECSRNHVGNRYTDCVPQTMFELGYLNEESARHLAARVGCDGVTHRVVKEILDAKYEGCIHHFTPRGLSYEQLTQYLPPGMSTLGGYYLDGQSDVSKMSHAVIVFNEGGRIGYMDGQRKASTPLKFSFTAKQLKTLTLAYTDTPPTRIHEVTPEMIDAILIPPKLNMSEEKRLRKERREAATKRLPPMVAAEAHPEVEKDRAEAAYDLEVEKFRAAAAEAATMEPDPRKRTRIQADRPN